MSTAAVGLAWATAVAALARMVVARRALSARLEAVALACHELRGPLAAVRLGIELGARTAALSPARMRALELELDRAALALDDLEGLGRGGEPQPGFELVDVGELLMDSLEAWRGAALAAGVDLRLRCGDGPAVVRGDRLRLAQATGNLIGNAIEHGGGAVEVRARRDGRQIRIEVIDEGPGLSAPVAELSRGREQGGRRDRERGRRRGHGLRIVSAIAAAHGGGLAAAPSEGGARLVLELPAAGSPESWLAGGG